MVQLLVSHGAFRAAEVCPSEGGLEGKYRNSIISVLSYSQLLCFHLVLLCYRDFQSEAMTKAEWRTANYGHLLHHFHSTNVDRLAQNFFTLRAKCRGLISRRRSRWVDKRHAGTIGGIFKVMSLNVGLH